MSQMCSVANRHFCDNTRKLRALFLNLDIFNARVNSRHRGGNFGDNSFLGFYLQAQQRIELPGDLV